MELIHKTAMSKAGRGKIWKMFGKLFQLVFKMRKIYFSENFSPFHSAFCSMKSKLSSHSIARIQLQRAIFFPSPSLMCFLCWAEIRVRSLQTLTEISGKMCLFCDEISSLTFELHHSSLAYTWQRRQQLLHPHSDASTPPHSVVIAAKSLFL